MDMSGGDDEDEPSTTIASSIWSGAGVGPDSAIVPPAELLPAEEEQINRPRGRRRDDDANASKAGWRAETSKINKYNIFSVNNRWLVFISLYLCANQNKQAK